MKTDITDTLESMTGFGDFNRLERLLADRWNQFQQRLEQAPRFVECPRHNTPAALDEELSRQAGGELIYACPTCEQEKAWEMVQRRMPGVGIPADVRHATLENFALDRPNVKAGAGYNSPREFLAAAKRFLSGEIRNLILAGSPGIGKGHLSAAIATSVMLDGRSVRWVTASDFFAAIHRSYDVKARDTKDDVLRRYSRPSLLVLDEIALRALPADGEDVLFSLIDARHKARLQTLLTSNKPKVEVQTWLGDRIRDRLRSGNVAFVFGEWSSMRGNSGDGAGDEF